MSDWGRIHRKLHEHKKVEQAGLKAMGLWTIANSWSRDNRTAGFVPDWFVEQSPEVAARLVEARLWLRVDGGYEFKDWAEWNSDDGGSKTAAAKLVHETIPPGHPADVVFKLTSQVSALLIEGIDAGVIRAALKLWLAKSSAPPSWLPMLVSDAARQRGSGERDAALREAWRTGETGPLVKFGYVFTPPDLPHSITTVEEAKQFMREAKRAWIAGLRRVAS